MTAATRSFHLGDVLSVTTGRFLAPGGIDAVQKLLDFMTGDSVFTHQIPRVVSECEPRLLEQHPQLRDLDVPEFDGDRAAVDAWLAEQVARFGEHLTVSPLDPADHTRIDPITEMRQIAPHIPVIGVIVPDPEDGAS